MLKNIIHLRYYPQRILKKKTEVIKKHDVFKDIFITIPLMKPLILYSKYFTFLKGLGLASLFLTNDNNYTESKLR